MAKILIVDDSTFIRTILAAMLNELGYSDVIEAENGAMAIEKTNSEKPDIVLLDIIMPDKDGIEVLKEIGATTKVCMISAVGNENMIKAAMEQGALDYITKPFEQEKIKQVIKKILA